MKQAFGKQVEVEQVAGSGGVYEVTVDGKTFFSKKQLSRFPDPGEIVELLKTGV